MRPKTLLSWTMLAASLLAGCGGAPALAPKRAAYPNGDASLKATLAATPWPVSQAPGAPPPAPLAANDSQPPDGFGAVPPVRVDGSQGPMLIYTATLTLAVFDVGKKVREVEDVARNVGGFLATRTDTSITIRVPASKYAATLDEIAKLGDVIHRDAKAEDVTEEFADLDVRLKNARAMRDRLEQLLAKAGNVKDALEIERELARVAGEIERIEGRMKFLRDRAAYSTITANFQLRHVETPSEPPAVKLPFPWLDRLGLENLLSL